MNTEQDFPADSFVRTARKVLFSDQSSAETKLHAFDYLRYCLMAMINVEGCEQVIL